MSITNTVRTFEDIKQDAFNFGKATAAGVDSMIGLAKLVYDEARASRLNMESSKEIYLAYAKGQNETEDGLKINLANPDSLKNSFSKLNVFVKLAEPTKPDAWHVIKAAIAWKQADKADNKQALASTYTTIVEVGRAMNKDKDPADAWQDYDADRFAEIFAKKDTSDFATQCEKHAKALEKLSKESCYSTLEKLAFEEMSQHIRATATAVLKPVVEIVQPPNGTHAPKAA